MRQFPTAAPLRHTPSGTPPPVHTLSRAMAQPSGAPLHPHRRPPGHAAVSNNGTPPAQPLRHTPSAGLWHTPPAHPSAHIGGLPGHAAAPKSGTPPAPPFGTPPRQGYGTPSGAPFRPHRRPPRACGSFQQRHPSGTPRLAHPLRCTPSAGLWHTPPAHHSTHIGGPQGMRRFPTTAPLRHNPSVTPPRQGYGTPLRRTPLPT